MPYTAFSHCRDKHLHLGVSGSIAAYKMYDVMRSWIRGGVRVSVTLTEAARHFVTPDSFGYLGAESVHTGFFEGFSPPFAHLMPGQTADAFVIAPATASTIEAVAHGRADTLLACQALAYDRPIVFAAAMNTRMWHNPATRENWQTLRERGHICLDPGAGHLACGATGDGHIPDSRLIYLAALQRMTVQDMAGVSMLVTLGPTREYWDGVRFWSNPSSGLMGASVAVAGWLRGARVHVAAGPGAPWLPPEIARADVTTAREMREAALAIWKGFSAPALGVFTAAVADFRPTFQGAGKIAKDGQDIQVRFEANPDILAEIGRAKRPGQCLVGFAAQTDHLLERARQKLEKKHADAIAANLVNQAGSGFGSPENTVAFVTSQGAEEWPSLPKPDVAWRILDWYVETRLPASQPLRAPDANSGNAAHRASQS